MDIERFPPSPEPSMALANNPLGDVQSGAVPDISIISAFKIVKCPALPSPKVIASSYPPPSSRSFCVLIVRFPAFPLPKVVALINPLS